MIPETGGGRPLVIASAAKQYSSCRGAGLLRRGACHRAGHYGPDPLAPRNDEAHSSRMPVRAQALLWTPPRRIDAGQRPRARLVLFELHAARDLDALRLRRA